MYRPFHARNDVKQESRKEDAKNQNAGASSRHYSVPMQMLSDIDTLTPIPRVSDVDADEAVKPIRLRIIYVVPTVCVLKMLLTVYHP